MDRRWCPEEFLQHKMVSSWSFLQFLCANNQHNSSKLPEEIIWHAAGSLSLCVPLQTTWDASKNTSKPEHQQLQGMWKWALLRSSEAALDEIATPTNKVQVITTTTKKPPTTTTMTVRKSETNCSAFSLPLLNFAAIKIATRTQELNYGAQTLSLSLSLKHLQNALLSEVKEKHPKIQNQIQASSLQVVAKFSLTEETRKCVTVWRGREPPSERFKTRKTQAWWSTPQVIAKILLSQKTKSTPRRDRIQNSFPNWTI